MKKSWIAGIALGLAAFGVQAAPVISLEPVTGSFVIGDTFDLVLKGSGFDFTSGGATIDNVTGGQSVNLTFSSAVLGAQSVTIDPRWTFAAGNSTGTINNTAGTINGIAFGVFPATADDFFNIATIRFTALASGSASVIGVSGDYIGTVAGASAVNIAETYTGANITVSPVPEPSEWAMLVAGLGLVGLYARRRRESTPALPALV